MLTDVSAVLLTCRQMFEDLRVGLLTDEHIAATREPGLGRMQALEA